MVKSIKKIKTVNTPTGFSLDLSNSEGAALLLTLEKVYGHEKTSICKYTDKVLKRLYSVFGKDIKSGAESPMCQDNKDEIIYTEGSVVHIKNIVQKYKKGGYAK